MASEEERREQNQAFLVDLEENVLQYLRPQGQEPDMREVSFTNNKEQFTISSLRLPGATQRTSSLIIGVYKRNPVPPGSPITSIGHGDFGIRFRIDGGIALLTTSPFRDMEEQERSQLPEQFQQLIAAFTDQSVGRKVNAMDVAPKFQGEGFGVMIFGLGRALLHQMGVQSIQIAGDTTPRSSLHRGQSFYEYLGARHPDTSRPDVWQTNTNEFSAPERRVLSQLRVVPTRR